MFSHGWGWCRISVFILRETVKKDLEKEGTVFECVHLDKGERDSKPLLRKHLMTNPYPVLSSSQIDELVSLEASRDEALADAYCTDDEEEENKHYYRASILQYKIDRMKGYGIDFE